MKTTSRNVLLVTADSLRADHCGFLSEGPSLTPRMDEMAREGLVFENAVSPAPRTPTSIPTTFTGQHMEHSSADTWGEEVERIRRHVENNITIPEQLSEMGYRTVGFTANPWTSVHSGFDGLFHQFDRLDDRDSSRLVEFALRIFGGTHVGDLIHHTESFRKKRGSFTQWPIVFDKVLDTLDEVDEPYFFWLFLMDTHNPYLVPRADRVENSTLEMYYAFLRANTKFRHSEDDSFMKRDMSAHVERRVKRAYRDAVRSVDRFFETLLEDSNLHDTILVFHSDHGEAFNEHGTYGHQQSLYEENIHVPLLVWGDPEVAGIRVEEPVSLRSLPRLITQYAGQSDSGQFDPGELSEEWVISRTASGDKIAVRSESWKYVVGEEEELYDLDADPHELENVVSNHPSLRSELKQTIEGYVDDAGDSTPIVAGEVEVPDKVRTQLESLGYTK